MQGYAKPASSLAPYFIAGPARDALLSVVQPDVNTHARALSTASASPRRSTLHCDVRSAPCDGQSGDLLKG